MLETQDGLVTSTIEWVTLIPDIGCIWEFQMRSGRYEKTDNEQDI